jgi:hypothetical protein
MRIKRNVAISLTLTVAVLLAAYVAWSQGYLVLAEKDDDDDEGPAQLTQALKGARVSLETGLSASEREGTPISGKFEVEDGKLQLSIYTMKGGKFSEVIVDHKTGKIAKAEAITSGEDLTAAKGQSEAMAKARVSLRAAIDKAIKENKGYRPISVVPALRDGHPEAEVTLVKGKEFKTITAKLD